MFLIFSKKYVVLIYVQAYSMRPCYLIKEHSWVHSVGSHCVYDTREFIGLFFFQNTGNPLEVKISIKA